MQDGEPRGLRAWLSKRDAQQALTRRAREALELAEEMQRFLRQGRAAEAIAQLVPTLAEASLPDAHEAAGALLRVTADALMAHGYARASATVWLYLGVASKVEALADKHPTDLARAARMRGDHARAAESFERAGWFAHAAIEHAQTGDATRERACWEAFSERGEVTRSAYLSALAAMRLGDALVTLHESVAAGVCWKRAKALLQGAIAAHSPDDDHDLLVHHHALVALGEASGDLEIWRDGALGLIDVCLSAGVLAEAAYATAWFSRKAMKYGLTREADAAIARIERSDHAPSRLATLRAREALPELTTPFFDEALAASDRAGDAIEALGELIAQRELDQPTRRNALAARIELLLAGDRVKQHPELIERVARTNHEALVDPVARWARDDDPAWRDAARKALVHMSRARRLKRRV